MPKQCLVLEGGRSLLQTTYDRLDGLIDKGQILVVTGASMEASVREQLPELASDQFLVEPSPKNTAPAIAWAAAEVERRGGQIMAVLPSDQRITEIAAFQDVLRRAFAATDDGNLVLLGQSPTRPESGYGYIERGEACGGAFRVARFKEKPDADAARTLIDDGALWNGGMFVWRIETIHAAFDKHLPGMWERVQTDWQGVEAISIDRGILEKASNAVVIPCAIGWSDLGSWRAAETLVNCMEQTIAIDTQNLIIDAPGRTVAVLGISDLVIVDREGILMVIPRDQAHRVGELAAAFAHKKAD